MFRVGKRAISGTNFGRFGTFFGAVIPGAVLGTIAFYNYRYDRVTTNKLLFAGRISAISGQTFALVQTPYTVISGLIKSSHLKKEGKLPAQMLVERLKNLDRLEEQVLAKQL